MNHSMEFRSLAFWTTLCLTIAATKICNTVAFPPPSSSLFLRSFYPHDPRIINGTEALQNNTQHQVSIRNRANDNFYFGTGHLCGGSLISDNIVLCAAHCFIDQYYYNGSYLKADDFIVVMGNLNRFEKNNNTLSFDIKQIVKYKEIFNVTSYDQDLVLLILNDTVPADHPTVKPITLNGGPLESGTVCQATGWGLSEEGATTAVLMTVDVPIISYDNCRKRSAYGESIHVGMLCAGYMEGERDACKGDSGGPLVCNQLQAGIVSWGVGCALPLQPGVYTDVAYYKDWILAKAAEYNGTLPKFVGNLTDGVGSTGGNSTTVDGGNDGSISMYNGSLILAMITVVFNIILSKF